MPARPVSSSLSTGIPVFSAIALRRRVVGNCLPFSQSDTVGWDTWHASANSACVMPRCCKYCLSASMAATIGYSDILAIGYTDDGMRHASSMRKAVQRTFLDRAMEAYEERFKERPTQAKVAALVGKKQSSAAEWRQPGRFPEMGAVTKLAEEFGVTVEWLLTGRGPRYVPPVDKDAQALWSLWPRLDELSRSKVVAYAETRVDKCEEGPGSSAGAGL